MKGVFKYIYFYIYIRVHTQYPITEPSNCCPSVEVWTRGLKVPHLKKSNSLLQNVTHSFLMNGSFCAIHVLLEK
jgi:hypothetical protein